MDTIFLIAMTAILLILLIISLYKIITIRKDKTMFYRKG